MAKKWQCPICGKTHDLNSKIGRNHYKRYKKSERLVAKMSRMRMESTTTPKGHKQKRTYKKFEKITDPKR